MRTGGRDDLAAEPCWPVPTLWDVSGVKRELRQEREALGEEVPVENQVDGNIGGGRRTLVE
jgi:hypothetical protein